DGLIGVRAFMRWDWRKGNQVIRSVRAVDTATHPDFQGKGIFRKLTMQLAEQCKNGGIGFIFNTPNKLSRPGYLKMGWESLGRMPVFIMPFLNFGRSQEAKPGIYSWNSRVISSVLKKSNWPVSITTAYSLEFLEWRYHLNPNIKYHVLSCESEDFFAIFRIKPFRFGKELRICEVVFSKENRINQFAESLEKCAKSYGANLVTFAGVRIPLSSIRKMELKVGPVITINPLRLDKSLTFEDWRPTLGDMELF
ncbi:MAG: GNAT family N-acetyltransferase, partial [Cyclobacteriaceae bacterium]|nr:GNAT family N-acetyltransferase [Cyclobacteriaceae bacterium]